MVLDGARRVPELGKCDCLFVNSDSECENGTEGTETLNEREKHI